MFSQEMFFTKSQEMQDLKSKSHELFSRMIEIKKKSQEKTKEWMKFRLLLAREKLTLTAIDLMKKQKKSIELRDKYRQALLQQQLKKPNEGVDGDEAEQNAELLDLKKKFTNICDRFHILKIKQKEIVQNYCQTIQSYDEDLKKLNDIKQEKQKLVKEIAIIKAKIESHKVILKNTNEEYGATSQRVYYLEELKKKWNNQLQQQRGNIRVFCRIKPSMNLLKVDYQITDQCLTINKKSLDVNGRARTVPENFIFDRIFDEESSQQNIFQSLDDLIQCSLDGKNVCIFAYGQTGSGKTFTMNGSIDSQQVMGVIPRSLEKIFLEVDKNKQRAIQTTVSISISEIYNDECIDLSDKEYNKKNAKKEKNYKDKKEVQSISISSFEQAIISLNIANQRRSTAFTQSNNVSSRSHLIFTINFQSIIGQNIRDSSLVLVDLAGSERLKTSQAEGDRQKQAVKINSSLTELGIVLRDMKNERQSTFRGCELIKSLQPYLEGDGKAVMFINVSPDCINQQITLQSLRFATSVRQCKIVDKNVNENKEK